MGDLVTLIENIYVSKVGAYIDLGIKVNFLPKINKNSTSLCVYAMHSMALLFKER